MLRRMSHRRKIDVFSRSIRGEEAMLIAAVIVVGLLTINFAALYWRALRESMAIGEYAQFLLLNPDSYADERRKFAEYLGTTGKKTTTERGVDAAKAIVRVAERLRGEVVLANAASRNAIAAKGTYP
jgi:hypothetical protein